MRNNTRTVGVVLAVLALANVVVAAIPPSVTVRVGGAELVGVSHYLMAEGALVSIAVNAKPGDTIWLVAASVDKAGEADDTTVILLMLGVARDGQLSGDFVVPRGFAGQSFELQAHAMNRNGEIASSTTVQVSIARQGRILTEPAIEPALDSKDS